MSLHRPSKKGATDFAAGRASRAIIASFSLLAIVLIGGNWIEEYLALSRDAAEMDVLQVEFDKAHQRRERLLSVETKIDRELVQAQQRGVGPDDIENIRDTLIGIVRDAGASLRRLEVGENEVRAWSMNEDDPRNDTAPMYGDNSAFVLHKHAVQIQADGRMDSINKVLKQICNHGWLMSTKNLSIAPTGTQGSMTSIEITLMLYGLKSAPEDSMDDEDEFAMRASLRQFR